MIYIYLKYQAIYRACGSFCQGHFGNPLPGNTPCFLAGEDYQAIVLYPKGHIAPCVK